MTRRLRLLLLAVASLGALALSSSALAAFVPQLAVSNNPRGTGANGSAIFRVTVPRTDDAVFRIDIYVPAGYTAPLAQNVGATIGRVSAQVEVREPIAGAVLPVQGNILVENPANHTTSPCAPGAHTAVWMLVLQASGQELRVPAYVDRLEGAAAQLGAYRIRFCLPSPHIPAAIGGATFGAKLIQAQLELTQVFATPATSGEYLWRAIATPWAAPATPNAGATVEARATIAFPTAVTVSASSRRKVLTVRGRVVEGPAGVSGANVTVRIGRRAFRVRSSATGAFTVRLRFRRAGRTTVQAAASVPVRTATCSGPSAAPAGCVSHTRAFFTTPALTSRTLRVRVR
jgi:hypothetical protein